ncbi:MAG TPA: TonB-dependent receptor [Chitinophagales bacterium]|nr:TonB-dependent receptor [Chitinophagales bacterium]
MKLLRYFLSIFTCLLITLAAAAHTGTLEGTITDNITNRPIEGVAVSVSEDHLNTTTNAEGHFVFENIPVKRYTITLGKDDYIIKEIKIILTAGEVTQLNIALSPSVISLPDLVVQGDVPVSAASSEILNIIDFQLRPKNSAQDMLRLVPGLFIAQHAGGGKAEQIFVRGFDCDHGTDVATYVDGMPVNMPSHGHGQGYADLHFLIPEAVKNMDITKGPYFAQNGDFSTGATVRFNTVNQLDENSFTTELTTAPAQRSFSGSRALLMMQLPFQSAAVNSYIAGDFIYNPGYFDASQQFHRFTLFNKNVFQLSEKTRATISFNGFGSSWNASGQLPNRSVKDGSIDRFGAIDTLEGGTTSRNNLNVELHSKVGGNDFYSQMYFGNYRFKLFSDFTFFLDDPINGDMIEQTDDRSFLGYNGSYGIKGHIGTLPVKTTLGLGFRSDKTNVMLWHAPQRERLSVTGNSAVFERSMNGWIKEELNFSSQLKAELGLRIDYFTFDVNDLMQVDSMHADISGYNYQSLAQPKLNLVYSPAENLHFFFNSGIGFHSNDARSVVQDQTTHRLPLAAGGELGAQVRIGSLIFSVALWTLELENELVYIGDEGATENKGPSRRMGIDFSGRYQVLSWLYADLDINYAKGILLQDIFGDKLAAENIIPLAPRFTSTGGLTVSRSRGWEGTLRYRLMADRPANESNTVTAEGYFVIDAAVGYRWDHVRIGLNIENLTNTEWNEAQFATESRLFDEPAPVDELHFTPGTPIAFKGSVAVYF